MIAGANRGSARQLSNDVDLAIIGAGPTGLYATYYAGFRGMSVALVDSQPVVGGQVATLYPEKVIGDVAGFPGIRGEEFIAALSAQSKSAEPALILNETVTTLDVQPDGVVLETVSGTCLHARAVLISGGIGVFTPREITELEPWIGSGASYYVESLEEYSGRDVVVIGGGDSAFDWSLALHPLANSVTLVHRRPRFTAHDSLVGQAVRNGVVVHAPYTVLDVVGEADRIRYLTVAEVNGSRRIRIPADAVIGATGFKTNLGPIRDWGLTLTPRGVLVDRAMRTNLERVFAAGDVADFDGKVRLMSVGFGEAATAVNHAKVLVDPDSGLAARHSTDAPQREQILTLKGRK